MASETEKNIRGIKIKIQRWQTSKRTNEPTNAQKSAYNIYENEYIVERINAFHANKIVRALTHTRTKRQRKKRLE